LYTKLWDGRYWRRYNPRRMQGIESQSSKVGTGPSDFVLVLFPVSLVDDIVGI
jgi:hypothetical protein